MSLNLPFESHCMSCSTNREYQANALRKKRKTVGVMQLRLLEEIPSDPASPYIDQGQNKYVRKVRFNNMECE